MQPAENTAGPGLSSGFITSSGFSGFRIKLISIFAAIFITNYLINV